MFLRYGDGMNSAAADTGRAWEQAKNSKLMGEDTSLDEYLCFDSEVFVTKLVMLIIVL